MKCKFCEKVITEGDSIGNECFPICNDCVVSLGQMARDMEKLMPGNGNEIFITMIVNKIGIVLNEEKSKGNS